MIKTFDPEQGLKELIDSLKLYQEHITRYYKDEESVLRRKANELELQKHYFFDQIQEEVQQQQRLIEALDLKKAELLKLRSDHTMLQSLYYDMQHKVDNLADVQEQIHFVISQDEISEDSTEVDISDIDMPDDPSNSLLFLEEARDILPFSKFHILLQTLEKYVKKEITDSSLMKNVSDILLPNYDQLYNKFLDSMYTK